MKKCLALMLALLMLCAAALAENIPDTSRVADASEMTDVEDIVPEGMTPVTADMLNEGVYDDVVVESSSSMFKIVNCTLTVKEGQMTALLEMKSDAYTFMYPGTAEEASKAPYEDLHMLQTILETAEGEDPREFYAFILPVDALDAGYTCAAFSARKQAWYPRTLLFRADSLPLEAWQPEALDTVASLGLADGQYTCEVALVGEGRASLASPAALTVENGACTAEIVFSTSKIDYVIVDGQRFEPTSTENGAAFTVPVAAFGRALSIIVDSTAMTPAVEKAYTMTFDPSTIAE